MCCKLFGLNSRIFFSPLAEISFPHQTSSRKTRYFCSIKGTSPELVQLLDAGGRCKFKDLNSLECCLERLHFISLIYREMRGVMVILIMCITPTNYISELHYCPWSYSWAWDKKTAWRKKNKSALNQYSI